VCDPAIGSGAFPVGMLTEIAKARKVLELYLGKKHGVYELKRHCIQNSLYGVDIDPGAIEIAKLRLWLSLVVDEDDYQEIQPLPNLDYKIMQGNSLIEEFYGISLDIEKKSEQKDLFAGGSDLDALIDDLHQKQDDFFNADHPREKKKKRDAVEKAIYNIFHNELEKKKNISSQEANAIETDLKEMTHGNRVRNFFPWKLYFADVFREKGGFDVVIANPPYITFKGKQKVKVDKNTLTILQNRYKNSAEYKINSFALFIEQSTGIIRNNGSLTFIIPSTLLQNEYLKKVRKYLLSNFHIDSLLTFGNKIFEAVTDSLIISVINRYDAEQITTVKRKDNVNMSVFENQYHEKQESWYNEEDAIILINLSTKDQLLLKKLDDNSTELGVLLNVYVGIVASGIKQFLTNIQESSIHKKYLQGKHLNRFNYSFNNLFIRFDKKQLHSNTNEKVYELKEKLLLRKTGNDLITSYDDKQYYTDQSIYNIYLKNNSNLSLKYVLSLLNSKLLNYYFKTKMVTNADVYPYIKGIHLKKLPLIEISLNYQKPFIYIVDQILTSKKANTQANTTALEAEIDQLVYELYGLTDEEIQIVEESVG